MAILRNLGWLSSDTVPLNPIYCYSVLRVLTNKTNLLIRWHWKNC